MPSGKTARPHITDNKDGTITIKYQPTERGLHEMDIKYEGNQIPGLRDAACFCCWFLTLTTVQTAVAAACPGSPLQFFVDAVNTGVVTAYGPGLSYGTVNKAATFTVVTKNAGEGSLSAGRVGRERSDGGLTLPSPPLPTQVVCPWLWKDPPRLRSPARTTRTAPAWCPTCPRLLETTTSSSGLTTSTFLGVPSLPRSPVRSRRLPELGVSASCLSEASFFLFFLSLGDDTITRTSQLNVGTSADVSLKIAETDLSSLTASIRAPSGNEEPCLLKKLPNRHLGRSAAGARSRRGQVPLGR